MCPLLNSPIDCNSTATKSLSSTIIAHNSCIAQQVNTEWTVHCDYILNNDSFSIEVAQAQESKTMSPYVLSGA